MRRLWSLLRECGIEAVLDLPAAAVRQDWTQWMCMQIREADYVLVIASPGYRRGGDGLAAPDDGRGVQFEAGLIRDMVFRDRAAGLRKVLPVLLPGATIDDVPQFLSPSSTDHYHVGDFTVTGAERLLRVLTSQPRDVDGPLGSLPVLPTTPERTSGSLVRPSTTLLHLSDIRFRKNGKFAGAESMGADKHAGALFGRLHDDLRFLRDTEGVAPDLVVISGDLTATGMGKEFDHAERFLQELAALLELPRERVVIVPGDGDVNRKACEAYFNQCAADDVAPLRPYWPKWEHFAAMFRRFYAGQQSIRFDDEQPWTLFELADLRVVVAAVNSTVAESHLETDHHGFVGEDQLRWFSERLRKLEDLLWLRIGVVHHNVPGGAGGAENLRDGADLERLLSSELDLLLHGHAHDGRVDRVRAGVVVLSTGSTAPAHDTHPPEAPIQYQVVAVEAEHVRRWVRCYEPNRQRWVADVRIGDAGSDWRETIAARLPRLRREAVTPRSVATPDHLIELVESRPDDFLDRIAEITRLREHSAEVTRYAHGNFDYLRVSTTREGVVRVYPVGGCEHTVGGNELDRFVASVHDRYRAIDPHVVSELVYGGERAPDQLVESARRRGVRLVSFVEYQGILDLRGYRQTLLARLYADPIYPPWLYVPQRYSMLEGDSKVRDDVLKAVVDWLAVPQSRLVLVLGTFGIGKTFLLHELARRIPDHLPDLVPLLIELRSLQKAGTLEELVAQHLTTVGEERIDHRAFRYMLREGRLVLLFDGFDELDFRMTYERAADHLRTLLQATAGQAKVVLTSRTQHFVSDEQVKTALGARVDQVAGRRLVRLERFDDEQIMTFLVRLFDGDEACARRRFDLIRGIRDLLGLSHNPRMLAFIADLDEAHLRDAARRQGSITPAELYRLLLTRWLEHEVDRAQSRGGAPTLSLKDRWEAVEHLAVALWQRTERALPLSELTTRLAEAVVPLAARHLDHRQRVKAIGSGTLLVRDEEGGFGFVHHSVMEWLVARYAANLLSNGQPVRILDRREMSALMADFFRDLAGRDVGGRWARAVLAQPTTADAAKRNALLVLRHVGDRSSGGAQLAGQNLRAADLSGRDLRGANLTGADLTEATVVGANLAGANLVKVTARRARMDRADLRMANLTGSDLTGTRLVGADLRGAVLQESALRRAALIGVRTDPGALTGCDVRGAAGPDCERVEPQTIAGGPATALALSPDGELLAAATGGVLTVYDTATGQPLRTLDGHTGWVRSLAFSPDGSQLASAANDNTVRLWDAAAGEPLHLLEGHTGRVRSVAFSPDGRLLGSAGADRTIRLWDAADGQLVRTIGGRVDQLESVAFSPDGCLLASASRDGNVRLWDAVTGGLVCRLDERTRGAYSVAFGPWRGLLATAGPDQPIRLWNAAGKLIGTFGGRPIRVLSIAISPDGRHLAAACSDRNVRLWNPVTDQPVRTLEGHTGRVLRLAFSRDGRHLASASSDQTIRLWDASTWQHVRTLDGHSDWVRSVAFSPDGATLISAGDDRSIRLWDARTGRLVRPLGTQESSVWCVAVGPTGHLVASAGADRTIRLMDSRDGRLVHTLGGHGKWVKSVAFSPNGRMLASGAEDRTVRLWDVGRGRILRTLGERAGTVRSVAFSPDGRALANTEDGTVSVWDLARVRVEHLLVGHTDVVWSVAFSPDGRLLASGGSDQTVRVWDAASGRLNVVIQGHRDCVRTLAFSPDGHLLASAGNDHAIRLWHPATGRLVRTLDGHRSRVRAMAFSPGGRTLASAGGDRTVRLWNPATGECHYALIALADGWACLTPSGRYKLEGTPAGEFWYAAGLCRFEPGELDRYVASLDRLDLESPLL